MAASDFEDLVENFELFDDWEDRYRYVIDLGRDLPVVEDALKTSATKVEGCASQVWLIPEIRQEGGGPARLYFEGDSDAMIVRGLIAILRTLYCGRTLAEVRELDASAEFARLSLEGHLSSQRSNGLKAMIARLNELARSSAA